MLTLLSLFIRTTFDALLPFLAYRVNAIVGESVLDAALARSVVVAFFTSFLAID